MRWTTATCLAALALVLQACGGGGGDDLPVSTFDGIEIVVSTIDPIVIRTSVPGDPGGFVGGSVRLTVDGQDPLAGTVELNGVPLPPHPTDPRWWMVAPAHLPPLEAGGRITLVAKVGGRESRHVFDCPPALAVQTRPDPIVRGAPVTVAWTGQPTLNGAGSIAPAPALWFCAHWSAGSGYPISCGSHTPIDAGASSLTVAAPALSGDLGFLLQLDVTGRLTQAVYPGLKYHQGICVLEQRVHLDATGP